MPAQLGGDYAAGIEHRTDNLTFDNLLRKAVLGSDNAENAVKFTAAAKERRGHAGNAFTEGTGIQCIALATNICKLTEICGSSLSRLQTLAILHGQKNLTGGGGLKGKTFTNQRNNFNLLAGINHIQEKDFLTTTHSKIDSFIAASGQAFDNGFCMSQEAHARKKLLTDFIGRKTQSVFTGLLLTLNIATVFESCQQTKNARLVHGKLFTQLTDAYIVINFTECFQNIESVFNSLYRIGFLISGGHV